MNLSLKLSDMARVYKSKRKAHGVVAQEPDIGLATEPWQVRLSVWHCGATTSAKLFTLVCLCHSALV